MTIKESLILRKNNRKINDNILKVIKVIKANSARVFKRLTIFITCCKCNSMHDKNVNYCFEY